METAETVLAYCRSLNHVCDGVALRNSKHRPKGTVCVCRCHSAAAVRITPRGQRRPMREVPLEEVL